MTRSHTRHMRARIQSPARDSAEGGAPSNALGRVPWRRGTCIERSSLPILVLGWATRMGSIAHYSAWITWAVSGGIVYSQALASWFRTVLNGHVCLP